MFKYILVGEFYYSSRFSKIFMKLNIKQKNILQQNVRVRIDSRVCAASSSHETSLFYGNVYYEFVLPM